jgi:branched-chain amino acid transport system permease protein
LIFGIFADYSTQYTVTGVLINLILVVGLYIFAGNSGIMSFGHPSFMAIGAYACALMTIPPLHKRFLFPDFPTNALFILHLDVNPVVAALAAGLLAAVFAMIVGYPLMRLSGMPAGISTLALLVFVNVVISNWDSVTHGTSTIVGVPQMSTLWSTLLVAEGVIVLAFLYQTSGRGLRLRAIREDQYAASALGMSVVFERWVGFVLSAFVLGLGGAMYAYFIPFQSSDFYLTLTFYVIAVLVIGGRSSLWGAVLGTTLVALFTETMRHVEQGVLIGSIQVQTPIGTTDVGLGLAMLLVLLLRPDGLTGGHEAVWPWDLWARRRTGRVTADTDATAAVQVALKRESTVLEPEDPTKMGT